MKNINKISGTLLALIFMVFAGCNKFDSINSNPDTTTEVSASMLCTNVILKVTAFSGRDAKAYIAENAFAKYVGYANEGQMAEQYNNIGGGNFGAMTLLPNVDKMLEYAKGSPMESSYKGVAKFARAYMFYKLTMEMGDIPYSNANGAEEGAYRPKYDAQVDVFKGILDELKGADQDFATGATFTGDPTPYNGNPAKWRKATNAFALQVLMSLSSKESDTKLNVKARFAEIVAANNLLDKTTGFFGLVYSSQNKHPLSSTNDLFTSKTIVSSLLMGNLKNNNDRRLFYFSEPAVSEIIGGKTESDMTAYVGVDVSMNYAAMNAAHSAGKYSLLNKRYLKEEASESRRLLTFGEQQLIIAEGILRGWVTGSAQTYYQDGVKSALADVMIVGATYAHGQAINQAYIDNYFTGEAAFKMTAADQMKQIWMQRYFLNFMQNAELSYFEYRRNKYPEFPINPSTSLNENNTGAIPMRWLYPGSETNYNRENLIEALKNQFDGYDEINKIMWLLK